LAAGYEFPVKGTGEEGLPVDHRTAFFAQDGVASGRERQKGTHAKMVEALRFGALSDGGEQGRGFSYGIPKNNEGAVWNHRSGLSRAS
jgi:hypothetical protein